MKRILAVGIILLFIVSSISLSNNAGVNMKNERVVAEITYRSNEVVAPSLQPLVVITSPKDGAIVTDSHLTVLGYAQDEAGMNYWEWEWRYKGGSKSNSSYFQTATYVEFRIDIYGLHPGWNLIIVRFKNVYGVTGEDSVNVTYNPPNKPPNKPSKPQGPTRGKVKTTLYYTTVTTDPDGDSLEYLIDWGDGSSTGWLGPITSGTPFQSFHAWDEPGTYEVRAKARDIPYHEESEWSDALIVTIYGNDTISPVVIIEWPEDEATFTQPNITITGYATDNVGVTAWGYTHHWEGGGTGSSWPLEEPSANYSFEIPITLHDGWNKIKVYASDEAGNNGSDNVTVYYNVSIQIDLDIVWQANNNELVPDNREDNVNAHIPGRALSLNRGANHLKRIYIRNPVGERFTLDWSDGLEIYENKDKTGKVTKGKQYTIPKEFWVEAIKRSNTRNDQWVEATLVKDKTKKDKVVFTNFQVEITVRCSGKVSSQAENDKHNKFANRFANDDSLGLRDFGGRYGGAVEIVGQLLPNTLRATDFFNDEFYWRQNYDERIYINDRCDQSNDNHPDDPWLDWQDVTPSNTGKIYYLDFPRDPLPANPGDLKAVRLIFETWCTFMYHEEPGNKGDATNDNRPTDGYIDCSVGHGYYVLRTTFRLSGWDNDACWEGNLLKAFSRKPIKGWLYYHLLRSKIYSITPNKGKRGQTVTVTIKGNRFFNTPSVALVKWMGLRGMIWAKNIQILSKNEIRCTFDIPKDFPTGKCMLLMTTPKVDMNGDGTKDFSLSCFLMRAFRITK